MKKRFLFFVVVLLVVTALASHAIAEEPDFLTFKQIVTQMISIGHENFIKDGWEVIVKKGESFEEEGGIGWTDTEYTATATRSSDKLIYQIRERKGLNPETMSVEYTISVSVPLNLLSNNAVK